MSGSEPIERYEPEYKTYTIAAWAKRALRAEERIRALETEIDWLRGKHGEAME